TLPECMRSVVSCVLLKKIPWHLVCAGSSVLPAQSLGRLSLRDIKLGMKVTANRVQLFTLTVHKLVCIWLTLAFLANGYGWARMPVQQYFMQIGPFEGFGQIFVHPRSQAALPVFMLGAGSQGDNWCGEMFSQLTYASGCCIAVQVG